MVVGLLPVCRLAKREGSCSSRLCLGDVVFCTPLCFISRPNCLHFDFRRRASFVVAERDRALLGAGRYCVILRRYLDSPSFPLVLDQLKDIGSCSESGVSFTVDQLARLLTSFY